LAIRKRGKSYQIDYFDPAGKRVRQAFKRRKDAEAELAKRVSLIAEGRYLDVRKEFTATVKELVEKYKQNYSHQASLESWGKFCLESFKGYFGAGQRLSEIKYIDLETYRTHLST
jgi:DNA-binding helix-hairpin-helix protein with protein kinase domain